MKLRNSSSFRLNGRLLILHPLSSPPLYRLNLYTSAPYFTMGAIDIPPIQYTPVDQVADRVARARKTFHEHQTRDVEYRLVQLRKLYWA